MQTALSNPEFELGLNPFPKAITIMLPALPIYIYILLVRWLIIVNGDLKGPFSIATILRCRGGHYFFPWIALSTFDPYFIMHSVKQGDIKYHFLSLWYDSTWDWTLISQTIGEHSNHYANHFSKLIYIFGYCFRMMHSEINNN